MKQVRLAWFKSSTVLLVCADVAQLVEQLIRNEQVTGSIPAIGSIKNIHTLGMNIFYKDVE